MRRRTTFVLATIPALAASVGAAFAPVAVRAQAPGPIDPQARALVSQMVAAYKGLSSYAGILELRTPGPDDVTSRQWNVVLQKPDRAAVWTADERGVTRIIADKIHLYIVSPPDQNAREQTPLPSGDTAIESVLRRAGAPETALGLLLDGQNPLAPQASTLRSLALGGTSMMDGVAVVTVVARLHGKTENQTILCAIGQKDFLLRQMTVTAVRGHEPFSRTETHTDVRSNPVLPAASFMPPQEKKAESRPRTPATLLSATDARVDALGNAAAPSGPPPAARPDRHDFGEVSLLDRTRVEQTFTFKNDGASPLVLERLASPCGCLSSVVASPHKAAPTSRAPSPETALPTLNPGEETLIRVVVDLAPLPPGPVHKHVSLFAQGREQPVARFELVGTIVPAVTFTPALIDFGQVAADGSVSRTLIAVLDARLAASGALPPLVSSNPAVGIMPSPPTAATSKKPVPPNDKTVTRTYTLTLTRGAPVGPVTGKISFAPAAATAAILSRAAALLVGQVTGDVMAEPQTLALGLVSAGRGATGSIALKAKSQAALRDIVVTSASPWLTTRRGIGRADQSSPETLEVVLSPRAPSGVLQTRLTVTLANGQRVIIPVNGYVQPPP